MHTPVAILGAVLAASVVVPSAARTQLQDSKAVPVTADNFVRVTVQFGGCDEAVDANINCLPITPGWNYIVRLYRPRPEILEGKCVFPGAKPVK